jgi:hypothetical protein
MVLALRELQAALVAHVVDGDRPDLVAAVMGDSISAAARLRIHRHHIFESLAAALGATFATVQRLVGEDFFRKLAHAFIRANLPVQPVLSEYGADFPAFVELEDSVQALPYLGDVARLDWALNIALHAVDSPRLDAAALGRSSIEAIAASPLPFAPGTSLLCSVYPVDRIWAVSQPGAEGRASLDGTGARLLVVRDTEGAGFLTLDEGERALVAALIEGQTLERATDIARTADPALDLPKILTRFLAGRCFAASQHE